MIYGCAKMLLVGVMTRYMQTDMLYHTLTSQLAHVLLSFITMSARQMTAGDHQQLRQVQQQ